MRKIQRSGFWVLFCILGGAYFLLGFKDDQSRSGIRALVSALLCNNDNVCEYEEWNSKSRPENQPCPDCRPKVYPPLSVDQSDAQMVTSGYDISWSNYKIVQFKSIGTETLPGGESAGLYVDSWMSSKTSSPVPATWIGDADNDGQKEIIALVDAQKGKKVLLYKTGSTGNPSWQGPVFAANAGTRGSVRIGDVDGDSRNEIVMDIGDRVWICRIVPGGQSFSFQTIWTGPSYGIFIWNMDIGDADNMGDNEIVLAVTNLGSPIILKHIDNAWVPQDVQKTTVSAIDVAKIRDLDGILGNGNEIIASGNNNKLMVWKFEGGSYQFKSISGDLGGFTQGVDAGDVDGDGSNEIATAATGIPTSVLYVFRYEAENASGAFQEICRMTIDGGTGQLRTVDLDNNGRSEIALENNGLSIFEFAAGTLVKRFNCIFGEYFENVWRNR